MTVSWAIFPIPVPTSLNDGDTAFEICFDVLKNNGNVLIFAEGDCERMKKLRRLKKGTARMAFQAYKDFGADVHIVPMSINYTEQIEQQK